MSIYKNGKLVAGGRQCMPLLSFMWSDHILNDASWLRADTFSWQSGAMYQAAYQHLAADCVGKEGISETIAGITVWYVLADDGHKICPASEESNVTAIYNATGVAWYYIIDTTNQRFKLPRTKFGFTGLRDTVGNYIEPGLPNITGAWASQYNISLDNNSQCIGAIESTYSTGQGYYGGSGAVAEWGFGFNFNASRSNSIYGNSDTVQPKASQMYLYFYVGNFTQTALENTAGVVTEDFNELNAHKVIAFQAPTAENNYTWYRKYADGWVEQGGLALNIPWNPNGGLVTVSLPITMKDTNYTAMATLNNSTSNWNYPGCRILKSTSDVTVGLATLGNNQGTGNCSWEVKGMSAN